MKTRKTPGTVLAALSTLSLLVTASAVTAQTPSSVYKNMYGSDCVIAASSKDDDGESTYAHLDFLNTCNRSFSVKWYINDVFRGTCFVKALETCGGTIVRADLPKMSFTWEP